MDHSNRLLQALAADQPLQRLREEAQSLLAEGYDRETLLAQLERLRQRVRQDGRASDEDIILDVMDFLTGWRRPGLAI